VSWYGVEPSVTGDEERGSIGLDVGQGGQMRLCRGEEDGSRGLISGSG
jgi:hypothetical protein